MSCIHLLKIVIYFILFYSTFAVLVNRTIDDQLGDEVTGDKPIFQPSDGKTWMPQGTEGGIKPDPKSAFNGTWTAAFYRANSKEISITLKFKGTAIYVFFILSKKTITGRFSFLDGNSLHLPRPFIEKSRLDTEYNATILSKTDLANSDHTLEIFFSTQGPLDAYINFDYAIYTVDESLPGETTSTPLMPTSSSAAGADDTKTGSNSTTTSQSPSQTAVQPPIMTVIHSSTVTEASGTGSTPNPTPPTKDTDHHSISIPLLVGIVLGILTFIILLLICFYYWRLRLKSRSDRSSTSSTALLDVDGASSSSVSEVHTSKFGMIAPFSKWNSLKDVKNSSRTDILPHYYADSQDEEARGYSVVPESMAPTSVHTSDLGPGDRRSVDEVRERRQRELKERLIRAQSEMDNLTSTERPRTDELLADTEHEMEMMHGRLQVLTERIKYLRVQQTSDWALGLSDDPPPLYTQG